MGIQGLRQFLKKHNIQSSINSHADLLELMQKETGLELLPTYAFWRMYTVNSDLKKHKDRGACEISLTITLQKDEEDWPIWIKKPNGEEVSLNLNPGDAMMYLGCVADHWREAYQGNMQTQVFFHYVRANGPRAYAYFDKERRQ